MQKPITILASAFSFGVLGLYMAGQMLGNSNSFTYWRRTFSDGSGKFYWLTRFQVQCWGLTIGMAFGLVVAILLIRIYAPSGKSQSK
jgi:hypothetical protein